jgi:hypothetical protein
VSLNAQAKVTCAITHPRNVYLAERGVLPRLDDWLAQAFRPTRISATIDRLYESQVERHDMTSETDIDAVVADCDDKLARYRLVLEAGADPALIAIWTAEAQARKSKALASKRARDHRQRMSKAEIRSLDDTLGNIQAVLGCGRSQRQGRGLPAVESALDLRMG